MFEPKLVLSLLVFSPNCGFDSEPLDFGLYLIILKALGLLPCARETCTNVMECFASQRFWLTKNYDLTCWDRLFCSCPAVQQRFNTGVLNAGIRD